MGKMAEESTSATETTFYFIVFEEYLQNAENHCYRTIDVGRL